MNASSSEAEEEKEEHPKEEGERDPDFSQVSPSAGWSHCHTHTVSTDLKKNHMTACVSLWKSFSLFLGSLSAAVFFSFTSFLCLWS